SALVNKVTSRGFIRKQGLVVYSNDSSAAQAVATDQTATTSLKPATTSAGLAKTIANEAMAEAVTATDVMENRRKEARLQGYEGESCPECQNFTLVRYGTCLKCNTCGATTGCS
ncbi:MAG: hypothetical protein VXW18_12085, partial [Pseudomonadota bacterium]|nr:hypothetical protein [Pseudomonadota bacterium]